MIGSKSKRVLFASYFVLVLTLLARAHPLPVLDIANVFPANPEAVLWEKLRPGPVVQYRGSEQRTGFVDAESPRGSTVSLLVPGWNAGFHGASKSSPVGIDGRLFVGSDAGRFAAFDLEGRQIWEYLIPRAGRGVHSTAATFGNGVCFGTYHGYLVCLAQDDGRPLWVRKLGDAIGASPLVANGRLFVSVETTTRANGYVVALDPEDGRFLWRSMYFGNQPHSSPALSEDGKSILVCANTGKLYSLKAETGELNWAYNLGGDCKGTPMIAAGSVYVTSWAGKLAKLHVNDGALVWLADLKGRSQSSPTLLAGGKRLMVASAKGVFVVATTDGRVLREFPWIGDPIEDRRPSALALRDNVWITCGSNLLCRFSANGEKLLQRIPVRGFVSGMPWVQNRALWFATDDGGLSRLN